VPTQVRILPSAFTFFVIISETIIIVGDISILSKGDYMSLQANNEGIVDPHNNKSKFEKWKKRGREIKYVEGKNREIILNYLEDMESGYNVNSQKRGGRSYSRMNALRVRLPQIANFIKKRYDKSIEEVTAKEIVKMFSDMEKGVLRKLNGKRYISWKDYVKDFKAFWHWYQRHMKREHGTLIDDITEDLDATSVKNREFVYFTIDDLRRMTDNAKFEYKVLMWFLFDSGCRAPQEAANIKVSDLTVVEGKDILVLNIRDEVSKTFGRKIKLMLCCGILKRYIKEKNLGPNDFLFRISPRITNQYIKRLAEKSAGKNGLTMYDFRHASACYWLSKYNHESILRYRFGWKNPEMIEYYSQFMGIKDNIQKEDLEDAETRTEMQRELELERKQREVLQEQVSAMQHDMEEYKREMKAYFVKEWEKQLSKKLENI